MKSAAGGILIAFDEDDEEVNEAISLKTYWYENIKRSIVLMRYK